MTSDGVPRIPAPLPANDASLESRPRLELRAYRHVLELRENFFSLLLGAPEYASDDTLWLPQYVRTRTATSDNVDQLFQLVMVTLFHEVMSFRTKALGVAKRFAKLKLGDVEPLLSNLQGLRSALQQIAADVPDANCVQPGRGLEGASRMLELYLPPVGDDLESLVRHKNNDRIQYSIFVSIMLGDARQGAEPSKAFWFHDLALKERVGDTLQFSKKLLIKPFTEVVEFGARATDVAMAFAKMDSVHAQELLEEGNLAELRSTLEQFASDARVRDHEEIIDKFTPPFEAGPSTADALLENTGFDVFQLGYDFELEEHGFFERSEGDD